MYGFGGEVFGGIEGVPVSAVVRWALWLLITSGGVLESFGGGGEGVAGVTVGVRETFVDEGVKVG
ncbi:hypothetical protein AGMMS49921_10230 [Endomicrobiia bacterium]|nr:hypothetical protein AGMMS49921_10230 [Endomicrobiia bacterium]